MVLTIVNLVVTFWQRWGGGGYEYDDGCSQCLYNAVHSFHLSLHPFSYQVNSSPPGVVTNLQGAYSDIPSPSNYTAMLLQSNQ